MPATITVCDRTTAGDTTHEFVLDLLTEHVTVRELIRSRVHQEVKDYNAQQSGVFQGLIQPSEAELAVNGYKLKKGRMIDWHKQFDAALAAFQSNQVLLLVDDRQVEDLDEQITVTPQTRVTFLKLVLLVGG